MPKRSPEQKQCDQEMHTKFTTVGCAFQPVWDGSQLYTFKAGNEIAKVISIGDIVAVQAAGKLAFVQVMRIDSKPKNPLDIKLSWVIDVIDPTYHDNLVREEHAILKRITKQARIKAKNDVKQLN